MSISALSSSVPGLLIPVPNIPSGYGQRQGGHWTLRFRPTIIELRDKSSGGCDEGIRDGRLCILVTADELPDGAAGLALTTRLNGEVVQHASLDDMIFGVAPLVSFLSHVTTLEPGDVIACGTPSGVGFARTPPLWMAPGDVCEVEIERIGRLRNPVVQD
jgi:Fumarylacetoacetate (FAA) hydrolase family